MTTFEIIQIFIGSGGLLGILIVFFRMGKFAEKMESMDNSLTNLKSDIKEIKGNMVAIEVQLGKLETRVEERTLRVVQPTYVREPAVR